MSHSSGVQPTHCVEEDIGLGLLGAPAFGYQIIEAVRFPRNGLCREEAEALRSAEEELVSGRKT